MNSHIVYLELRELELSHLNYKASGVRESLCNSVSMWMKRREGPQEEGGIWNREECREGESVASARWRQRDMQLPSWRKLYQFGLPGGPVFLPFKVIMCPINLSVFESL